MAILVTQLFCNSIMSVQTYKECKIYVDIMTGKNLSQFRFLFPLSFIGQFVHPVGVEEIVLFIRKKKL